MILDVAQVFETALACMAIFVAYTLGKFQSLATLDGMFRTPPPDPPTIVAPANVRTEVIAHWGLDAPALRADEVW